MSTYKVTLDQDFAWYLSSRFAKHQSLFPLKSIHITPFRLNSVVESRVTSVVSAAPLQRSRAAQQRMTRQQQWRIFCATCTVPWPVMPFGSMRVRTSCRMPRWLSSAALWTASLNWPSTPTRMETFSETSEWLQWDLCHTVSHFQQYFPFHSFPIVLKPLALGRLWRWTKKSLVFEVCREAVVHLFEWNAVICK